MSEFQILYTLVVTFFVPTYPVTERFVTEPLSYHATELLCEQEKEYIHKRYEEVAYPPPFSYTLRCDPPDYEQ